MGVDHNSVRYCKYYGLLPFFLGQSRDGALDDSLNPAVAIPDQVHQNNIRWKSWQFKTIKYGRLKPWHNN